MMILSFILFSCSKSEKVEEKPVQWNLSILIDLSDRISPELNPNQAEKDKQLIKNILSSFRRHIRSKNVLTTEDKIQTFFYPKPTNAEILKISRNLQIDFEQHDLRERKIVFRDAFPNYISSINTLYAMAVKNKVFKGADLYSFFKSEIEKRCMIDNPNYRNILIVLTDGYLYWKHYKQRNNNRFTYITAESPYMKSLRSKKNLADFIKRKDYGLLPVKKNYSNLELAVMELDPIEEYPVDYQIMELFWSDWLGEMDLKNYAVYRTDTPELSKQLLEKFINREE